MIDNFVSFVFDVNYNKDLEFLGILLEVNFYVVDFGSLEENFVIEVEGYLWIFKISNYIFWLISDDGLVLFIDDEMVIDNDGFYGDIFIDGEVVLVEGYYLFCVLFFQGLGGCIFWLIWCLFDIKCFEFVFFFVMMYCCQD